MSDWISRSAAFEIIKREDKKNAMLQIARLQSAELMPVIHAHWIEINEDLFECSNCHNWLIHYDKYYPKYCSECGAKMDEDLEENS